MIEQRLRYSEGNSNMIHKKSPSAEGIIAGLLLAPHFLITRIAVNIAAPFVIFGVIIVQVFHSATKQKVDMTSPEWLADRDRWMRDRRRSEVLEANYECSWANCGHHWWVAKANTIEPYVAIHSIDCPKCGRRICDQGITIAWTHGQEEDFHSESGRTQKGNLARELTRVG